MGWSNVFRSVGWVATCQWRPEIDLPASAVPTIETARQEIRQEFRPMWEELDFTDELVREGFDDLVEHMARTPEQCAGRHQARVNAARDALLDAADGDPSVARWLALVALLGQGGRDDRGALNDGLPGASLLPLTQIRCQAGWGLAWEKALAQGAGFLEPEGACVGRTARVCVDEDGACTILREVFSSDGWVLDPFVYVSSPITPDSWRVFLGVAEGGFRVESLGLDFVAEDAAARCRAMALANALREKAEELRVQELREMR